MPLDVVGQHERRPGRDAVRHQRHGHRVAGLRGVRLLAEQLADGGCQSDGEAGERGHGGGGLAALDLCDEVARQARAIGKRLLAQPLAGTPLAQNGSELLGSHLTTPVVNLGRLGPAVNCTGCAGRTPGRPAATPPRACCRLRFASGGVFRLDN